MSNMDLEMTTQCQNWTNSSWSNGTNGTVRPCLVPPSGVDTMTIVISFINAAICLVGFVGNGLVIFVVLRYAKMKTVTNMYILNLAVADICFLVGVPFLLTTALLKHWIFGPVICKLFYISTSINWFTSVFTLTVMSADRYMAVCHPVRSMNYRTPLISRIICVSVWTLSFLVMLPIILYAHTRQRCDGKTSCTLSWPQSPLDLIPGEKAFIIYAFILGFAAPVALICVFYALVVLRLRTLGPKRKAGEKRRSHKKVTIMVLAVIAVYVICWLPFWCFQVILTFGSRSEVSVWSTLLFQAFTVLSYLNSTTNPILYAFLSENFRKSFIKAFKCMSTAEVNITLQAEPSVFQGLFGRTKTTDAGTGTETITMTTTSVSKNRNGLCLNNDNIMDPRTTIMDPRTTIMAERDTMPEEEEAAATQV